MAVKQESAAQQSQETVPRHGPVLTGAYIVGLLLVFVGQRLIGEAGTARTLLDGVGVAICGGAMIMRLVGRARMPGAAARVETIVSALYGVGLLGLGVYALSTPWGAELMGQGEEGGGVVVIFAALWPALLICTVFPLLFIELSYNTMPVLGAVELRRVYLSGASGLTLGLALTYLTAINYTATQFEVRRDLTFFRTSMPSEATINMVKRLDTPVDVVLFYPQSNEVLDVLRPYFDELQGYSELLRVKRVNHVMAPRLAKQHGVRGNGKVLVLHEDFGEAFDVGLELDDARNRLKRLDESFQVRFSKVTRPGQIFYTTVGHGERAVSSRDQAEGEGIGALTRFVKRFGLRRRTLGLAQGLGSRIPDDATVVAVLGPQSDFLPEEVRSLVDYVERGGRLLLMLEPGATAGLEPLLERLGLEARPGTLAHEQLFRLLTDTQADRTALVTNRYGGHAAVRTARQNGRSVATVLYNAGSLTKRRETGDARVDFLLRSVSGTWADLDGDLTYDRGEEHRMTYAIAAAVELEAAEEASAEAGAGDDAEDASGEADGGVEADVESSAEGDDEEAREGRAIVIADVDVFSDRVFENDGNRLLAADIIPWLSGNEAAQGRVESLEDPVIQHTRSQDLLWFWSTVFLIPAAVLAFGLFFTSRRRRRRSEGRS